MIKFTLTQQHLWNLFYSNIRKHSAALLLKSSTAYQKRLPLSHLVRNTRQNLHSHKLSRRINIVTLRTMPLLPINIHLRFIHKPLLLRHSRSKHIRIILLIDYQTPVSILLQQRRSQLIKLETSSTMPIQRLGDTTLIRPVNHFFQTFITMRISMIPQLYTYIPPVHLMSNSSSCA